MLINADLRQPAAVRPDEAQWVASPATGVTRLMLERDGGEVARATSLVRFAPGAAFDAHDHDAGEEYFVLDGTFSDETGDYPAGAYVRNPPGSRHTPFTTAGATIFVKLRQFQRGDDAHVVVDTNGAAWLLAPDGTSEVLPLHEFEGVRTFLARFAPGVLAPLPGHPDGIEMLVLDGSVTNLDQDYPKGSWLRRPGSVRDALYADGATLLIKTGHLHAPAPARPAG